MLYFSFIPESDCGREIISIWNNHLEYSIRLGMLEIFLQYFVQQTKILSNKSKIRLTERTVCQIDFDAIYGNITSSLVHTFSSLCVCVTISVAVIVLFRSPPSSAATLLLYGTFFPLVFINNNHCWLDMHGQPYPCNIVLYHISVFSPKISSYHACGIRTQLNIYDSKPESQKLSYSLIWNVKFDYLI